MPIIQVFKYSISLISFKFDDVCTSLSWYTLEVLREGRVADLIIGGDDPMVGGSLGRDVHLFVR